jgi:hypothetical protein
MVDPFSSQEIVRRADRLRSDRGTTESHWQEVADYLMPSREFTTQNTPGSKRTAHIFHTGPVMAAELLAGALHGMQLMPNWMRLRPSDPQYDGDMEIQGWLDDATEKMLHEFSSPRAKFSLSMHENYLDDAAFGTSVIMAFDRGRDVTLFKSLPLSECYLSENDDGDFDTLYRCYKMRAYDVINRPAWAGSITDALKREAANNPDAMWEIVHGIIPDPKHQGEYADSYVLKRSMIQMGGVGRYRSRPFVASRWSKRSGETYGNGPGMNALPDVKELNKLEEEHLRGVMLANAPPLALPDDGFLAPLSQNPRALNYYRTEMGQYQDRVFQINTGDRPEVAADKILNMEARVDAAFYIKWMQLPFKPGMTATEINKRHVDQLRLMGPMGERGQTEKLGPLIDRAYTLMMDNGKFLPPPSSMNGISFRVEYASQTVLAQKGADAERLLNYIAALGQIAAGDPTVMDIVDMDEIASILADRMGAPAKALRDDRAVAELRQMRQKRDQQTQMAQAATVGAQALQAGGAGVKALAEARATGMQAGMVA